MTFIGRCILPFLLGFYSFSLVAQTENIVGAEQVKFVEVIQLLEQKFDVSFLYETDILEGYQTEFPKININQPIEDVLDQLFESRDLLYIRLGPNSFAIRKKNIQTAVFGRITDERKRPLAGATIYFPDQQDGTFTGVDGRYQYTLPPGEWEVVVSYVGKQNKKITFQLNAGESLQQDFKLNDAPFMEEIIVAGPRVSSSSLLEIASPASVLSMQKFEKVSNSGLSELLHNNIPSFHSTNQTIADGTDHLDPATLKGLGPDQLLVLINGKRRHQSALVNINGTIGKGSVGTDLNAIPIAAIEKIEILRDGASVHYGSDAIAGVINVVLKENDAYIDVFLKSGISTAGDGFTTNAAVNSGFALSKKGGFLNLTLNYLKRTPTNRSGNYSGPVSRCLPKPGYAAPMRARWGISPPRSGPSS